MLQDLCCIDHLKWVLLLTIKCHNALAYCLKGESVEEKLDIFFYLEAGLLNCCSNLKCKRSQQEQCDMTNDNGSRGRG